MNDNKNEKKINHDEKQNINQTNKKFIKIKVAILANEPIGWGSCKHYFPVILNDYKWTKKDITYKISAEYIYDKDICKGKLTTSKYDLLLVPGGGVGDGESIIQGFNRHPKVKKWKKNLSKFIKDGGGYVGICGGTALLTGLNTGDKRKPTTFTERQYNKSSVGVSCVNSFYKYLAIPLIYPFQKNHPEKIGATGYVFSFSPGATKDGVEFFTGGVPVDFQIFKNHPIFSDFPKDTERMRWWGGPALIIPDKPDRDITVLARYPKEDFSKNPSTKINAWSYRGGILGLLKALIKSFKIIKDRNISLNHLLTYAYYLAGNWSISDKNIELDFPNKASITAEVYPNENKGRILLCTAHPEYMIWWDGEIIESDPNDFNCLAKGLHKWINIHPLSKSVLSEMTYTWWVVRRFVAWAAKVPDENLPPISPGELNEGSKKLISDIFYDGDIVKQMENI